MYTYPPTCLWARAASLRSLLSLVLVLVWLWFGSGSGLGLDLGLSWWKEAFLIGPTHFSPLLLALIPGPFGLLFGLPFLL